VNQQLDEQLRKILHQNSSVPEGVVSMGERYRGLLNGLRTFIDDITQAAVVSTVIDVEKRLCGLLGREWSPTGISVETLVEEIRTKLAR
jgi:hypothetical protein